jgi:hypothetical protein
MISGLPDGTYLDEPVLVGGVVAGGVKAGWSEARDERSG